MSVFEELWFHRNNAKFLIFWATKWFKMHVPETMHPWWVYPIRNKLGRQGSVPVLKQIPYGHRGTGYLVSNLSGVWCFIRKNIARPKKKSSIWLWRGQNKGLPVVPDACIITTGTVKLTNTQKIWVEIWVLSEIHKYVQSTSEWSECEKSTDSRAQIHFYTHILKIHIQNSTDRLCCVCLKTMQPWFGSFNQEKNEWTGFKLCPTTMPNWFIQLARINI